MASVVTTVNSSWATAATWTVGQALIASDFNSKFRDEFNALKTPANFSCYIDEAANVTITSTSYVNVHANLAATIVTGGGNILLGFNITHTNSGNNADMFDIIVDGTTRLGLDDGMTSDQMVATVWHNASATIIARGLAAGSHSFALQHKNDAGTTTIYMGAGTASRDVHPYFWGIEQG